jgi:putative membrane protein
LREATVLYGHALKNSFIPVLTVIGIQIGHLLGGAVIIEEIFSLPGVGRYLLNGIYQRDYPVVQGTVLFVALIFSLVNLILGPILTLLSLPFIILTLGLFLLVVNAALLAITAGLSEHLDIDNFWSAVLGGLLIAIFSWLAEMLMPARARRQAKH